MHHPLQDRHPSALATRPPSRSLGWLAGLGLLGVVACDSPSPAPPKMVGAFTSAPQVSAITTTAKPGRKVGDARIAHLLAFDLSSSIRSARVFPTMVGVVREYIRNYVNEGEDLVIFEFSFDETGNARLGRAFPGFRAKPTEATIEEYLADLELRVDAAPPTTMTLFRPLAEELNGYVASKIDSEFIVMVFSDGKSDGPALKRLGKIKQEDVPFGALADRGQYRLPGVADWRVAVAGSDKIDLQKIFGKAATTTDAKVSVNGRHSNKSALPAFAPCLVHPTLQAALAEPVELVLERPFFSFPPFQPTPAIYRERLHLQSDCTQRRYRVEILAQAAGAEPKKIQLTGPLQDPKGVLVSREGGSFEVDVEVPVVGAARETMTLQVQERDTAGDAPQVLTTHQLLLVRPGWFNQHWRPLVLLGSAFALFLVGVIATLVSRRKKPVLVRIGEHTFELVQGVPQPFRADNTTAEIGDICWEGGDRQIFTVRAFDGWTFERSKIHIQEPLRFWPTGAKEPVRTVVVTSTKELTPPPPAVSSASTFDPFSGGGDGFLAKPAPPGDAP